MATLVPLSTVFDVAASGGAASALAILLPWVYSAIRNGWPETMDGTVATALAAILLAVWRAVYRAMYPNASDTEPSEGAT